MENQTCLKPPTSMKKKRLFFLGILLHGGLTSSILLLHIWVCPKMRHFLPKTPCPRENVGRECFSGGKTRIKSESNEEWLGCCGQNVPLFGYHVPILGITQGPKKITFRDSVDFRNAERLPPQNQNKSPQAMPEKGRYRLPHISKKVPKDEFEIAKDNPKNSLRFG